MSPAEVRSIVKNARLVEVSDPHSGVYFLWAHDDELLYVGESVDVERRVRQHRDSGKVFSFATCISISDGPFSRREYEGAFTRMLRPTLNGKGNPNTADRARFDETMVSRWLLKEVA